MIIRILPNSFGYHWVIEKLVFWPFWKTIETMEYWDSPVDWIKKKFPNVVVREPTALRIEEHYYVETETLCRRFFNWIKLKLNY